MEYTSFDIYICCELMLYHESSSTFTRHFIRYTLGSTLMLLSKHQEIQDKLRAELLSMGTDERSKSAYMSYIVKETSRLLPVIPLGTARRIGRDITCKNDRGSMIIPKGSVMYIPTMLLHRNPYVFEKPKEFLPERWENPTEEMRASVMTFSFGQVRIDQEYKTIQLTFLTLEFVS